MVPRWRSRIGRAALLLVCACLVTGAKASTPVGTSSADLLGEGTIWQTPWYRVQAPQEGPTVLITGGMHGNEPAGSAAAEQIRHWPIVRGTLIVVPQVNRLGLTADMRWFPPSRNDRRQRDLNRNFPRTVDQSPRTPLCAALWHLVDEHQPDLVVDLHEGFDFHIANNKSVGSSIIFTKSPNRNRWGRAMLDAVNASVTDDGLKFDLLSQSGAVQGSLVRACNDVRGIDAFILETTFKDQPLSRRMRQQRIMVSTLLNEVGLLDRNCVDIVAPPSEDRRLKVGLFDDAGASTNGLVNLTKALSSDDVALVRVGPEEMSPQVLRSFDVLLFPGGSGSKQGKAIGPAGREAVRQFVTDGGGIVGICAGAYLCSSEYDWSLHVINTAVYHEMVEIPDAGRKSMWYRGGASQVQLEFAPTATDILGHTGAVEVRYQNGPIVSAGPHDDLPTVRTLAWFRSEVARYEAQKGTMIDTPAIVAADFGQGRVLSISPHPEATPGLESVIVNAVRWVANRGESAKAATQ